MFKEVGLECGMKLVGSSTKVLSFTKPLQADKRETAGISPPDVQQKGASTAGEEQAEAIGTVLAS